MSRHRKDGGWNTSGTGAVGQTAEWICMDQMWSACTIHSCIWQFSFIKLPCNVSESSKQDLWFLFLFLTRHKTALKSKENCILLIVQSSGGSIKAFRLSLMRLKYLNTFCSPALACTTFVCNYVILPQLSSSAQFDNFLHDGLRAQAHTQTESSNLLKHYCTDKQHR